MKTIYRGHEIDVRRERCVAGYSLLYYSIFRTGDLYEVTSGFSDSADTVRAMIGYMRDRVDAEIEDGETFDPTAPTPDAASVVLAVDKGAERSEATAFSVDPISSDAVSTSLAARAAPRGDAAAGGR